MQIYLKITKKNASSPSFVDPFEFVCPLRTKFARGLWNGLRTCVCVCVSVCAQNDKFASSQSFPGRFWFWLLSLIKIGEGFLTSTQNFEVHCYANLFKNHKKCFLSFICWPIWIFFWFNLVELHEVHSTSTHNFEILSQTLFMLISANLLKNHKKCFFIYWLILIFFFLW